MSINMTQSNIATQKEFNAYGKQEAVMTRGMAILTMVLLHLFCRLGSDINYQPLIWVNSEKPFVYWIGFFCEICVPLYSMCAGYAQYLLYQKNKNPFRDRGKRILKLLENYWIVLFLFCFLALFFDQSGYIPGSTTDFIKSIFLLHSYSGGWWFLRTYIIILLIPSFVLMFPVEKINGYIGILLCLAIRIGYYLSKHFFNIEEYDFHNSIINSLKMEVVHFVIVLVFFWIGAFFCKEKVFDKISILLNRIGKPKLINALIILLFAVMFVSVNVVNKAGLIYPVAVLVFLTFNLVKRPKWLEKVYLFLGKHSTNIWLVHMFFIFNLFNGIVYKAKYPVLILAFTLVLCLISSYAVFGIQKVIEIISGKIRIKKDGRI